MLAAGPYAGEFGFEIMTWQANIRRLAKGKDRVLIGCRPESRALYEDFATSFWDVPSNSFAAENTSGCRRLDGGEKGLRRGFRAAIPKGSCVVEPSICKPQDGDFIRYGINHAVTYGYDVVIHPRYMLKGTPPADCRRSTPMDWWDKLVWALNDNRLSIAAIGLTSCSLALTGVVDMRGMGLKFVMNPLASSRCMVGPSSGPAHLSALCGIPQVVWTDGTHVGGYDGTSNITKLEKTWNPFGTPARILHVSQKDNPKQYWIPDLDWVVANIMETVNASHQ